MSADPAVPTPASPSADPARADPVLERLTGQRLRLRDLETSLAQSLDPKAVASRMLDAACGLLGAPQGWVAVVSADGAFVEVLEARGYDAAVLGPWTRVPLELATPMTVAIRESRPLIHRSAAERHAAYPVLRERSSSTSPSEASAVIPLVFEGRTTGALAVAYATIRDLAEDEVWFLQSLAAQGSLSLERARLFAALGEREERLRLALSASGTGTWDWSVADGRLEWSSEVTAIHGTAPGWVPPTFEAYLDLIHPEDRPRVEVAIETAVRTGVPYDEEFRIVRPDGSARWIQGRGRARSGDDGQPLRMVGTVIDINARRLAELERDRVLEAEREAARMRDAFIGVVSHELRTPITTIFGGTRVLARRWPEMAPEARDGVLSDVVEEADRLYRLVEDLLVLTRVERGVLDMGDEPVHLGRVLQRVVASERARWPEVTFTTRVPAGLPSVTGEDTYVEQILRNLLGNAAKYGGTGTTVTVSVEPDGAVVRLVVQDEGPGVDSAESEAIFELFYRSASLAGTVSGAGIGLFVCRHLVTAMGGTIRASRGPGGGARFEITLPRYEDDEGA